MYVGDFLSVGDFCLLEIVVCWRFMLRMANNPVEDGHLRNQCCKRHGAQRGQSRHGKQETIMSTQPHLSFKSKPCLPLLLLPTDRPTVRRTIYDSPITVFRAFYDQPTAACRSYDTPIAACRSYDKPMASRPKRGRSFCVERHF